KLDVAVAIDGNAAPPQTASHPVGSRSGGLELRFAAGYPSGHQLTITVTALASGKPVGANSTTIKAQPTCTSVQLAIGAPPASDGGGGGGGDAGGSGPLDGPPAADLAPPCPATATCIYVSQSGPSCPTGPGQGTWADPFCKIQDGFNAGNNKTVMI